jgi:shikimate 5-dehydrogenase
VYNPSETKFLSKGKAMVHYKKWYDMLTIQAEENWKIWQLEDAE